MSAGVSKKFGFTYGFGEAIYARSLFGDDGIFGWLYGFGKALFGREIFGSDDELTGVYQSRPTSKGRILVRMRPGFPGNPQTIPQQANRGKLSAAIFLWRALSDSQKNIWRAKCYNKRMSGYNLFLSTYIKNH